MASSPIRVDRVSEGHAGLRRDGIDDALGFDLEELEAAELAVAGVPAGGLFEEALLAGVVLVSQAPPQLGSLGPAHGRDPIRTYV